MRGGKYLVLFLGDPYSYIQARCNMDYGHEYHPWCRYHVKARFLNANFMIARHLFIDFNSIFKLCKLKLVYLPFWADDPQTFTA